MPLTKNQRVVHVPVKDIDYPAFDKVIREALEIFPDCRIISMNMHSYLWGSHVFVTIETL